MGKTRALYHRDNRTAHKGGRVESLPAQMANIDARLEQGLVTESWAEDAKAKVMARAKRYGVKLS